MNTASDDHGSDTSPESLSNSEAQELLAQADRARRSAAPAAPTLMISYGVLCATGSLGTIGLHLASQLPITAESNPVLLVMLPVLAWIIVGMVPTFLFRQRLRRGMNARWLVLMAVWGVLWVLGVLLAATFWGFLVAMFFLPLFVTAAASEAQHAKDATIAGRDAR